MTQNASSGGAADRRASALCVLGGKIVLTAEPFAPLLRLIEERASGGLSARGASILKGEPLWDMIS